MFTYSATVTDVYDGDTITVSIDLGFYTHLKKQKIRLYGINAPEMRGPEKERGTLARDYLRGLILGKEVIIRTFKDRKGKYGRWLAEVTTTDGIQVNQDMIDNGHAVIALY